MEINETELSVIKEYIKIAEESYQDQKTPEVGNSKKIANELYNKLFGWRDAQSERALQRPSANTLTDLFRELKFGRTGEDQKFLDKCIDEINSKK